MTNPNDYLTPYSDTLINPSALNRYEIASPRLATHFIYFLYNQDELVYVGQTINLARRISQHSMSDKFWTHYAFHTCSESLADILEQTYIRMYKPKYNKLLYDKPDRTYTLSRGLHFEKACRNRGR